MESPDYRFSRQDQIAGGRTPSIYKSMANSIKKRRKCSVKCMYFDDCPLMSMAISSPDKACVMKKFPESIRQRFVDIFLNGEEGMVNDIKKAIYKYGLTSATPKEQREYIELMLKLHKAVYGDKSQFITNQEPLQININQFQPNIKEIPIVVKESKRSIELKEGIMAECKEIADVEMDPESLFSSEKLDEIVRRYESEDEI
jgi:hypothetical protein